MADPKLEDVFKTSGVPTYTLVKPKEYANLIVNLRSAGRGLVIEGPSGIGKTTAVETALRDVGMDKSVLKLSARKPDDIDLIKELPNIKDAGVVIVDDFHKLDDAVRASLADYMKTMADQEVKGTKLIVVGINKAGQSLLSFAHDLVNRLDIVPFETNSDDKVRNLLDLGADALNVELTVADQIVTAAQGSFYLAQMLAREVCMRADVLEKSPNKKATAVSFESVKADVWDKLALIFADRTKRFCQGTKMKRAGRGPYLHVLRWLAEGAEWSLSLRDAMRAHPGMKGSVSQVVDKGYLHELVAGDAELQAVIHYDVKAEQLTVEDPQYIFFIRNIPWRQFTADAGFVNVDFPHKYDFALSFAGEDREHAERLAKVLQDEEHAVFYDLNEQHRILAAEVEEYLRPIYLSEARYVVALLSSHYPKKIWTKFESDQFKQRLGDGAVIPVWFSDAPPGVFDETRKLGGFMIDRTKELDDEIDKLAKLLTKKLEDESQRGPSQ